MRLSQIASLTASSKDRFCPHVHHTTNSSKKSDRYFNIDIRCCVDTVRSHMVKTERILHFYVSCRP
jgi:hypothetical protein